MKSKRLLASIVLIFVAQVTAYTALAEGNSTGGFHVPVDGGRMNIEFTARTTDSNGSGTGQMNFSAPIELPDVDEDNETGEKGSFANFSMKVEFDCVVIEGNRAAMSGLVRSANVVGYVGRRVILAVEDGGEGNAAADKFTWGAYGARTVHWIPTDAEADFDDGWSRTWLATDAEREDDPGTVISPNTRDRDTDCRSFALSAYSYLDVPRGAGNIQVRP